MGDPQPRGLADVLWQADGAALTGTGSYRYITKHLRALKGEVVGGREEEPPDPDPEDAPEDQALTDPEPADEVEDKVRPDMEEAADALPPAALVADAEQTLQQREEDPLLRPDGRVAPLEVDRAARRGFPTETLRAVAFHQERLPSL